MLSGSAGQTRNRLSTVETIGGSYFAVPASRTPRFCGDCKVSNPRSAEYRTSGKLCLCEWKRGYSNGQFGCGLGLERIRPI